MTRVRIENVVASTSLGAELDLPRISLMLEGAEYEPDRFPGLIYRLKQPKTAILLFHSGKVVCTGGKSWKQVDDTVRTVSEMIRKGGEKVLAHPKIQIQNIVATSNLGSELNLNSIAITLGLDRVEYDPEQFPGLVCRLEKPKVVVLLFGSGKMVCTGARRPTEVSMAVEKITEELRVAGLMGRARSQPEPSSPPTLPAIPRPRPTLSVPPGGPRERAAAPDSWATTPTMLRR
jgi:transcription initiation factor TFIID TATA-box-binding protein